MVVPHCTQWASCVCISCSVVSDSLWPQGLQPARLLCPWDSPGKITGMCCPSLLQRIFQTQGSNPGILHCRQIPYHLSYREVSMGITDVGIWFRTKSCHVCFVYLPSMSVILSPLRSRLMYSPLEKRWEDLSFGPATYWLLNCGQAPSLLRTTHPWNKPLNAAQSVSKRCVDSFIQTTTEPDPVLITGTEEMQKTQF